ncbi:hypothetical protein Ciccas_013839, partial [Cichlidogyrus casuarinus]
MRINNPAIKRNTRYHPIPDLTFAEEHEPNFKREINLPILNFEKYFSQEMLVLMVGQSNLYATQKSRSLGGTISGLLLKM